MPPKRVRKPTKGKPGKGKPVKAAPALTVPPEEVSQDLPPREAKLLREISREYEAGQYKRATKTADTILAKFPHQGETLALKALCIYKMNMKKEALEMVEHSKLLNRKTHLTWHVSGILFKQEKRYAEAVPMLSMAATVSERLNGRPNDSLLREVAFLHLHLRDMDAFHVAAHQLMQSSSAAKQRSTWHTCALANHLVGYTDVATQVLLSRSAMDEEQRLSNIDKAAKDAAARAAKRGEDPEAAAAAATLEEDSQHRPTADEHDTAMTECTMLSEAGRVEDASKALEAACIRGHVLSEEEADSMRAAFALRMGDVDAARAAFSRLAATFPEDITWVAGLVRCELGFVPLEFAPRAVGATGSPAIPAASDAAAGIWREPSMAGGQQIHLPFAPLGTDAFPLADEPLTAEQAAVVSGVIAGLAAAAPRSYALRSLPLRFLPPSDPAFAAAIDRTVRDAVRRGKESAVAVLEPLYAAAEASAGGLASIAADPRVATIGARLASLADPAMDALAADPDAGSVVFPAPLDGAAPGTAGEPAADAAEAVSVIPLALLLHSEHLVRCCAPAEALPRLDAAIRHTPTLPALHLCRARALGAMGAWVDAADAADTARTLDLADRAASVAAVQCMLRAGQHDRAWDAVLVFARPDSEATAYFRSMITFWMTLATARALEESGLIGRALRRYQWLCEQAESVHNDALDFYSYALRMSRIRSALRLLRWTEAAPTMEVFVEARAGATRCWLRLEDDVSVRTDDIGCPLPPAEGTPAAAAAAAAAAASDDAAKDAKDARRAMKRLRANEAKAVAAAKLKARDAEDLLPEADPHGVELTSDANPLARAGAEAQTLVAHVQRATARAAGGTTPVPARAAILAAANGADVALRRSKPILALRAFAAARPLLVPAPGASPSPAPGLDAALLRCPEVAPLAARFLRMAADPAARAAWPPAVVAVVDAARADPAWTAGAGAAATAAAAAGTGAGVGAASAGPADAASFAASVADDIAPLGLWARIAAAKTIAEAAGVAPAATASIASAAVTVPARAIELLADVTTGVVSADALVAARNLLRAIGSAEDVAAFEERARAACPLADAFKLGSSVE